MPPASLSRPLPSFSSLSSLSFWSSLSALLLVSLSLHCPRSNAAVDTRTTYATTYAATAPASATASATASDDADYFELPVSDVGPTSTASPGIHTLRIPRRHHRDSHRRRHKDTRPVAGVVRDFGR